MTVTAFIKKWGPEYAVMLALATLAVDFVTDEEVTWGDWFLIIVAVMFLNLFMREGALIRLPASMK